ncbi:MAG: hypothetical protein DMG30_25070 [Acidobacteria bacterium]|nr:MAG: hypothetical protein DMG30_25070 [Acidobacteriota bacterium]
MILPQLGNVLRGDMTFVGPRCTLQYQVEQYSPWPFARLNDWNCTREYYPVKLPRYTDSRLDRQRFEARFSLPRLAADRSVLCPRTVCCQTLMS